MPNKHIKRFWAEIYKVRAFLKVHAFLPLATSSEETILLYGLPAILPRLLYLSLVDDRAMAKEFLWIERTLQWLTLVVKILQH